MAGGPEAVLRDLRASRERLLAVVAGVGEEQFKRRPAPPPAPSLLREPEDAEPAERAFQDAGDWSIAEVLAHLLATEQRLCTRLEALLKGETAPAGQLSDEERNAEARQGRAVPVPQVIHGLLAARRRLERALTEGARTEPGVPEGTKADEGEPDEAGRTEPDEGHRTELKLRPYISDQISDEIERLLRDEVIAHEEAHRAQIEAVKAVLGAARTARG